MARTNGTLRIDCYTRCCLGVICVLLAILAAVLLFALPSTCGLLQAEPGVTSTEKQPILPDSAAQRLATVEAIKGTNERLDKIIALLESGKLKVVTVEASEEEKNGDASGKPKK